MYNMSRSQVLVSLCPCIPPPPRRLIQVRVLAEPGTTTITAGNNLGDEQAASRVGDINGKAGEEAAVATSVETPGDAAVMEEGGPPSPTAEEASSESAVGVGKDGGNDHNNDNNNLQGGVTGAESTVSDVGGEGETAEAVAAAVVTDEAVVLAEGPYSSGVLVGLNPARPEALKLTIGGQQRGQAASGGSEAPATVLLLGAVDG